MSFTHTPGGDMSHGGDKLSEPGTYHLVVESITDQPTKGDGTLINNAYLKVDLAVLDGTSPNQRDKKTDFCFFNPKPDASEKSKALTQKKVDFFLMAVGLATRQQIEKKESHEINLDDCLGRQLVAKFETDTTSDKGYLQLCFAEIYHVDDPAMKAVPKSADALNLISPKLRWPGGKPPGGDSAKEKEKPEPATPTTSGDEFSDL